MTRVRIQGFFKFLFSRIWTEYGNLFSVFSPNAGKYGSEQTAVRTLFTRCSGKLIRNYYKFSLSKLKMTKLILNEFQVLKVIPAATSICKKNAK